MVLGVVVVVVGKLCVRTADNQSQHIGMMIFYLGPESKLHMLVHHVCVTYFYALNPFHCTCLEVFWFENVTALPSCHAIGYLRPHAQCHNGVPFLYFYLPLTLHLPKCFDQEWYCCVFEDWNSCRVSKYHGAHDSRVGTPSEAAIRSCSSAMRCSAYCLTSSSAPDFVTCNNNNNN